MIDTARVRKSDVPVHRGTRMNQSFFNAWVLAALCAACPVMGQSSGQATPPKPVPPPAPSSVFNVWPGAAPGSESWHQKEVETGGPGNRSVRNVVTPTLSAYLP